ncbi:hypothetical protein CC78DRAFT_584992 [Lojkania enalia]|uniref:Uncharacterized protein n=1 Tax=Lojkania enalia TaxID=147567 RepID=A0A9P4K196_9PLEO|nr:hypothetical protein CC78DRAFT_584992 [Didymosphaeria enalia]
MMADKEDDVIKPIQDFVHALNIEELSTLFSRANTIHLFQCTSSDSLILHDLLFTCSSVDFGYEIFKNSRAMNSSFPRTYLYDPNQTMYTPLWKDAGVPYVMVSHESDTKYVFNRLFLEARLE